MGNSKSHSYPGTIQTQVPSVQIHCSHVLQSNPDLPCFSLPWTRGRSTIPCHVSARDRRKHHLILLMIYQLLAVIPPCSNTISWTKIYAGIQHIHDKYWYTKISHKIKPSSTSCTIVQLHWKSEPQHSLTFFCAERSSTVPSMMFYLTWSQL